jgi:hypothetical protein
MKLQKFILCAAVALTAFGVSLGLLEIGSYLRAAVQPAKREVQSVRPIPAPTAILQSAEVVKAPEITPPEVSNSDADDASCEFDEEGDYVLVGESPKGFEDFDFLSIVTTFYNSKTEKVIPIKPYGWIQTTKKFSTSWLGITGKRISFITQARKGVSYKFDGKFVDEKLKLKDENGEEYTEQVLLKGRLTKWRSGVKIAESKVRFAEKSCGC